MHGYGQFPRPSITEASVLREVAVRASVTSLNNINIYSASQACWLGHTHSTCVPRRRPRRCPASVPRFRAKGQSGSLDYYNMIATF